MTVPEADTQSAAARAEQVGGDRAGSRAGQSVDTRPAGADLLRRSLPGFRDV